MSLRNFCTMPATKLFLLSAILFYLTINCDAGSKQTKIETAAPEQKKPVEKLSILVIAPGLFFAKSHLSFAVSVVKVLLEKHNVHFVIMCRDEKECRSYFSLEHPNLNVDYYAPKDNGLQSIFMTPNNDPDNMMMTGMGIFYKVFLEMIQNNFLKGKNFDVGVYEESNVNKYATAVFHALGIENMVAITASSLRAQPLKDMTDLDNTTNLGLMDKYKNANPPIPLVFSKKSSFGDHNDAHRNKRKTEIQQEYDTELKTFYNKFKADEEFKSINFPGYVEMFKKIRFQWVNTQPQLEWDDGKILASAKKVGYIGGLLLKKKPLGLDIAEKVLYDKMTKMGNNVKIVLISFGTVFDTIASLKEAQFSEIRKMIDEFSRENPQKYLFVWKFTDKDERIGQMNSEAPNVYATHWVNQESLLASGKVEAFISHCGKNTQIEGVYYSVPMICVPPPPYIDWIFCSELLAKKQIAVVLQFDKNKGNDSDSFTALSIKRAVNEVAKLKNVEEVGKVFRQQIASKNPRDVILEDMEKI